MVSSWANSCPALTDALWQQAMEEGDSSPQNDSQNEEIPGAPEDASKVEGEIPLDLSAPSVGRLSLYYRELHRLLDSNETSVNSQQLGKLVNVSPAVVRRDLSSLGTIGRRGVGYEIATLVDRIGQVLGSGMEWKVVLIGVGSLGNALVRYRGFDRLGFTLHGALRQRPRSNWRFGRRNHHPRHRRTGRLLA